jgi:hypothetical protein
LHAILCVKWKILGDNFHWPLWRTSEVQMSMGCIVGSGDKRTRKERGFTYEGPARCRWARDVLWEVETSGLEKKGDSPDEGESQEATEWVRKEERNWEYRINRNLSTTE